MGLDMHLNGSRYLSTWNDDGGKVEPIMIDGFPLIKEQLEIGYWRKHAPLHHMIVEKFNDGEDDCRPIDLTPKDLRLIAAALRDGEFPDDEECHGFFFGDEDWWADCRDEAEEDAKIFDAAADWLDKKDPAFFKYVEYRASW